MSEFALATAMPFDLGVHLTVVGAVMALAQLSHIAQRTERLPRNLHPMDVDPSRDEKAARASSSWSPPPSPR